MDTLELDPTCREHALQLLEPFAARILPGVVRRFAGWKRIPRAEVPDLIAELRQVLAVDCLEHAEAVVELPPTRRHARWIRLVGRWLYAHRLSVVARTCTRNPDHTPARPPASALPDHPIARRAVRLHNGRCNLTASAARHGHTVHSYRRELDHVAGQLGQDHEYLSFWRRRLAEALVGLAADQLREQGLVALLHRDRPAPDTGGRVRRLRRLRARFLVRRGTILERRILAPWRRPRFPAGEPRLLLEQAVALCPTLAAGWLWLFEACLAEPDLAAAAAAIRSCRQRTAPDRCAQVLARARLLEVRGRLPAALRLLARARRRWPSEARLRLAAAVVSAAG